jgi:hypothetical protein
MTGNIAVARGAAGLVPPVSLAFWRWVLAALILLPFIFPSLKKQWKDVLVEFPKLLSSWSYRICILWGLSIHQRTYNECCKYGNYLFSLSYIYHFIFSFYL